MGHNARAGPRHEHTTRCELCQGLDGLNLGPVSPRAGNVNSNFGAWFMLSYAIYVACGHCASTLSRMKPRNLDLLSCAGGLITYLEHCQCISYFDSFYDTTRSEVVCSDGELECRAEFSLGAGDIGLRERFGGLSCR